MKNRLYLFGGSLFICLTILLIYTLEPVWALNGMINRDGTRVRSGPGTMYDIVTSLNSGTQVAILRQQNDWCQIKAGQTEGFVASTLIDKEEIKLRVREKTANLRSGPGTSYDKLGQVQQGDVLLLQDVCGDWYRVKTGNQLEAYISAALVETIENTAQTTPPLKTVNRKIKVLLDNKQMQFEVDPILENGRTLVPLRAIFEALGATVNWDAVNKTVNAVKGTTNVVLKIGSLHPTVNGKDCPLEVPGKIINGRTLVPLRFVAEAFGCQVNWDASSLTITIKSPTATSLSVIVTSAQVNLREEASSQSAVIDTAMQGERLPVIAEKDGWYQVSRSNRTPWVASWLVQVENGSTGTNIPQPPVETPTTSQPAANNAIYLQRSKDSTGLRIILTSSEKMEPEIKQLSGKITMTCKNRQVAGVNYLEEKLGSQKLTVQAANMSPDTQVDINLPDHFAYEILTEDEGRRLVVFIPNTITKIERSPYGSVGDRLVISSLCPVEHSESLQGNQIKICLKNINAGQNMNPAWTSDLINGIQITPGAGNSKDLYITIDTNNLGKYSTTVTGDNKDLNLFLFKKSAIQTYKKIVVLDPGHGGSEPGTHGQYLVERDVDLLLGLKVGEILKQNGIQVEYTRCDDTTVDLESRALLANSLNAAVFVSLHHNSVENPAANGTECFYYAPINSPELFIQKDQRLRLATFIHDELISTLQRKDRGVKEEDYSVLRNTLMPSALAEIVFISNPEEEQLAMQDDFEQLAAQAIARGIMNYLNWDNGTGS